MKRAIITLLTDFGTKDSYVASMKGVILGICPGAALIDITHQVRPHDVREGAFVLNSAFGSFPKGTIHVGVVDPGVGSPRRPLLFVTPNYFFVGPDNGLFSLALRREKPEKAIVLTESRFFLPKVSATFQGRDLFAPVAAHLAAGIKPERFGGKAGSWTMLPLKEPAVRGTALIGEIVHIDHFGNLVTNIDEARLLLFTQDAAFRIRLGRRAVEGLKSGYWEGKMKEPLALIGSGGFLEVSVREGSAQRVLKAKEGDPVRVEPIGK